MRGTTRGSLAAAAAAAAMVVMTQVPLQGAPAGGGTKGADWPQFRGARRDGISPETGLLRSWANGAPKQAWRRPIGEGFSGVAAVGGRLYTMYAADKDGTATEFAAALDPADGKEIWRTPVGARFDNEFGHGPRATPTVNADTVYVLGAKGTVMALAAKDGAVRWKLELTEAMGAKVPTFGYSASVVVDGGKLLVEAGAPEGKSLAGLDAATGKVLWTQGDGSREAGYASPLAVDLAGKRQYVHIIDKVIKAVDSEGKEVWSHPWPEGETHATPIFIAPDKIFASGVEGVGATLFQVARGPQGMSVKEVWKNPTFRTHFNASVLHKDHLYGFDNTSFKCISVKDGSQAWTKRGLGKGSVILADGLLLILADDGRLVLAEATPSGFEEKGIVQALQGRCWTPPALSGGRIYLRNHAELVAYDLKG